MTVIIFNHTGLLRENHKPSRKELKNLMAEVSKAAIMGSYKIC